MRALCVSSVIVLLAAGGVSAQYSVEADLDGAVGDPQPDYIVTSVGDQIPIDIWICGTEECGPWECLFLAFGIGLCEDAGKLTYVGTEFVPWYWALVAVPPDTSGCALLRGRDTFDDYPMWPPRKIATVTYEAASDQSVANLTLRPESGVFEWSQVYSWVAFTNNGEVLARIQIGDVTATEPTSWGSVKSLFR
ncbi:MAG: hypothetical protein FJY73_06885 [Candidatus Eisenbacteria bacterium]|nr:hypothetical protein [Candidatus Eisenbacteria bacterium]